MVGTPFPGAPTASEDDRTPNAQKRVDRIIAVMHAAFPDTEVVTKLTEPDVLLPVNAKGRHAVITGIAMHEDAIVTFNIADFIARPT